ncbi:MAG: hypothetical protein HY243_14990 [Proteobacteria bacterium]|nr:hypothetical protein [Pseudomonadota bacterium]
MKLKFLALAAACAISLGGCQTVQDTAAWLTQTQTTPTEAKTVDAAGHLFVAADTAADAFVKTDRCNKACADEVAKLSHDLRIDLDDALTANAAGDSAKLKVAMDAFNQAYPAFTGYLKQFGVTPTQ